MRRKASPPACEPLETRALLAQFLVTSPKPKGPGTLLAAIRHANDHSGLDLISFNLPSPTINLGNDELQPIRGKVVIDGFSQPGSQRNTSTDPLVNNAKVVTIVRAGTGPDFWRSSFLDLLSEASGSIIQGLGFANNGKQTLLGIYLGDTTDVTVQGCIFGVNNGELKDGTRATLTHEVWIRSGSNNTVGSDSADTPASDPARQNVMANFSLDGVFVDVSERNVVSQNFIGSAQGGLVEREDKAGVRLDQADHNTVTQNVFFKNRVPILVLSSSGNVTEPNTIIPRVPDRAAWVSLGGVRETP